MTSKPTYEELEQRVKELEKEAYERKRAEEALRESEECFRTTFEDASTGIALIANDGYFLKVNKTLCRILGYSEEELLGKTWVEITEPDDLDGCFDWLKRVKAGEQSVYEKRFIHKLGHLLWVMVSSSAVRDSQDQIRYYISLFQDITKRKQVEEALLKSEEKYRGIFENIQDVYYETNIDGTILEVSPSIESISQYKRKDLVGKSLYDIYTYPEQRDELLRLLLDKGKVHDFEINLTDKDGSQHPCTINTLLLRDEQGNPIKLIGSLRDISERKQAENKREQLEAQLRQAQKMESIGILAGGIAHDFNNLLTIILGNIEMAEDDIKPEVGISECLAEAEKASIQAQALTKQIITFAKGGAPVKKIGSIGNLVKETTDYSLSGSNVKCDFLILHDLWPVEFDEGQMKHAIKNIIDNAVESMPDEGTIHVRAENFNITAEQSLPLLEGKYVKISIRDHGVGIPEKHLSKIFDPYFSTKEMGIQKGMGLGLAITYSIINSHDGYITVESEVGVGTTFTLFLPAHEKDIRELKPIEILEPGKPSIRAGRILVMDDEESIRKLSKQRLGRLGYEPELAKDGTEAIELYKKAMNSGQPFDLVILDLTVKGGMGGKDAVKALLKIDPQVKAIVSSGYSNDPVMTDFKAYGFTGALHKPNTKKELIAVLKNITKE